MKTLIAYSIVLLAVFSFSAVSLTTNVAHAVDADYWAGQQAFTSDRGGSLDGVDANYHEGLTTFSKESNELGSNAIDGHNIFADLDVAGGDKRKAALCEDVMASSC